jgi:hypothetical protein
MRKERECLASVGAVLVCCVIDLMAFHADGIPWHTARPPVLPPRNGACFTSRSPRATEVHCAGRRSAVTPVWLDSKLITFA